MSATAEDAFVAEEIERLARQGASGSELLGMLPDEALIIAIDALRSSDVGALKTALQLDFVARILQVELDSR